LISFSLKVFLLILLAHILSPRLSAQIVKEAIIDDDLNAQQIIETYKPALVSIFFHNDNYYSYHSNTYKDTTMLNGSGFIIRDDGLIGTNYHVVEQIDSIIIKTSEGDFYDAELLTIDEKNDFAILRILNAGNKKFPFVKFGNSDEVKAGQNVYAIGSPLGYEYTISSGIVAAIRNNEKVNLTDPVTYDFREKEFDKVIQVTAAISPGNSGGALFNSKGDVIGITTYTFMGFGNLNFAVAINGFKVLLEKLEEAEFNNGESIARLREENLINSYFRLAENIKLNLSYNWTYSQQRDTMTVLDSFVVRQDSLNRINFGKAEKYYYRIIDLKPDTFIVYQDLLDMYVFTESFDKAENLYRDIRERFESDSLLNLLSSSLASAYSTNKDYDNAIIFYRKMLEQDSTQSFIYYQLANIYDSMGDTKRSESEYKKLIVKDPFYTDAYIQLGKLYYEKLNRKKLAKRYFNDAYEKELGNNGYSPYNLELYYYMGLIAIEEERIFDAILAYMEMKNIYSYKPEENEMKLKLYKSIKDFDR
jgi:tetratricopeptide (TPR) repeat protein